jgi:peroxiredoxin
VVVVVLTVGVVTGVALSSGRSRGDGSTASEVTPAAVLRAGGPQIGDLAPDFTATTLDGKTVKLSDYAGRPVVLNFWASWCNPCREEFPLFVRARARHHDDYVMLGVDNRDIASDAKSFAAGKKADWPIVFDGSSTIYRAYGVTALPQTFFIRPDGTVALRYYAYIPNQAELNTALAKITASTTTTTTAGS